MRVRAGLILVAAFMVAPAAAPPAHAQDLGPALVHASRATHGFVLHFGPTAANAYKAFAGDLVTVGCGRVVAPGFGPAADPIVRAIVRAPRHRGPLRVPATRHGSFDYCFVRDDGVLLALAPLGASGRTYVGEVRTARTLVLPFLHVPARTATPPATADVVRAAHGRVVALDGPDGSPPRGRVGYWTDGRRMVVAALTTAGRRLFIDIAGDVERSNASDLLIGPS